LNVKSKLKRENRIVSLFNFPFDERSKRKYVWGPLNSKKKRKKKEFMNGRFIVFDVGGKKHETPQSQRKGEGKRVG